MLSNAEQTASQPNSAPRSGGEIRLSFGTFYVVLKWGPENRSNERLKDERRKFPVLTSTHAPVLVGLYAALIVLMYFMLRTGLEALVYLFS